jgi:hypothetical protein
VDYLILDVGLTFVQEGIAYVGLSRVRTMENLFLIDFHSAAIVTSIPSIIELNRLKELTNKNLVISNLINKFMFYLQLCFSQPAQKYYLLSIYPIKPKYQQIDHDTGFSIKQLPTMKRRFLSERKYLKHFIPFVLSQIWIKMPALRIRQFR